MKRISVGVNSPQSPAKELVANKGDEVEGKEVGGGLVVAITKINNLDVQPLRDVDERRGLLRPLVVANTAGSGEHHPPHEWLRARYDLLSAQQLEHLISKKAPKAYANDEGINAMGEVAMTW